MTPSARVQAVLELLTLVDTVPRPADALISGYFRARRYIGSKDRGAVAAQAYAVMRHQARLDWWLRKYGREPAPRWRLLAYLRHAEGEKINAIEALCDGGKFAPTPLDKDERSFLQRLEGHTLHHPDMPDAVIGECPDWAAESLRLRFGKDFAQEMAAMLAPAPLDLRINALKITRDEAFAALKRQALAVEPCPYSPWGLRVAERPSLGQIALLKDGALEIQDEGSQLVALLVDAKSGERVVDFCAGAGGKTLAVAAQMRNKGRVIACDVLANRLKRSAERFRRAGLHNIEVKPLTTEHDPWVKRHKGGFDRVLVDAPCSGTGTWRRNPDARWRSLGPGLEALLPLQASILESAARLVKAGGRLVYATCSLLPEENERQIEKFLAAHAEFSLLPVQQAAQGLATLPATGPYLALTPAQHGTDGFFAAVMTRRSGPEKDVGDS